MTRKPAAPYGAGAREPVRDEEGRVDKAATRKKLAEDDAAFDAKQAEANCAAGQSEHTERAGQQPREEQLEDFRKLVAWLPRACAALRPTAAGKQLTRAFITGAQPA